MLSGKMAGKRAWGVALGGSVLVLVGLQAPAQAAGGEGAAEATPTYVAYYFRGGEDGGDTLPTGAIPVKPGGNDALDGVPDDEAAVSVVAPGQPDKETFLLYDLTLPEGAEVTQATLTLPLSESDGARQVNPGPGLVKAVKAGPEGFADTHAARWESRPSTDPEGFSAEGELSEDGTKYTFDLTGLAQEWTEVNDGVALVPADTTTPFQVVFGPRDSMLLTVAYTEKASEDVAVDDTLPTDEPLTAETFTEETFSTGAGDSGSGDGGFGFEDTGALPALESAGEAASAQSPDLLLDTSPEVAETETVVAAGTQGFQEFLEPTRGLLAAGVAVALLLAFLSLILGDPRVATPAPAARSGRVLDELMRRQRQGRVGLGLTPKPR